jgi:hypothetical protein
MAGMLAEPGSGGGIATWFELSRMLRLTTSSSPSAM